MEFILEWLICRPLALIPRENTPRTEFITILWGTCYCRFSFLLFFLCQSNDNKATVADYRDLRVGVGFVYVQVRTSCCLIIERKRTAVDNCVWVLLPSLMFWTNWNEQRPSIMRSTLAGKSMRIIISSEVLTPNGLTVDHKAEKLYFSDGSLGKIERCDYDGSSRYVSIKEINIIK